MNPSKILKSRFFFFCFLVNHFWGNLTYFSRIFEGIGINVVAWRFLAIFEDQSGGLRTRNLMTLEQKMGRNTSGMKTGFQVFFIVQE